MGLIDGFLVGTGRMMIEVGSAVGSGDGRFVGGLEEGRRLLGWFEGRLDWQIVGFRVGMGISGE